MQTPLRITFRHCDYSDALANRARELIERLERFHDHIVSCNVVVEAPSAHHAKGGPFTVTLTIAVPRSVIAVDTAHASREEHADPYLALRDAVDTAKRQLRQLALAS